MSDPIVARSEHPFVSRLRELPQTFPELAGNDMLARTARMVILPQMVRAAAKQPDEFRATAVRFLARFVVALHVAPEEIYAPSTPSAADNSGARAELEAASPSAPAETPPPAATPPAPPRDPGKLDRILAGE